ncbi:MAG: 50S ribosomal protein L35 [Planctomycetes bacterium]|nr:50S ribosomal protein L35 [Planctomycetota bacterium]
MTKLKTKKSVSKRMKFTKSGKIKRYKAGRRHLMTTKNGNKKRKMRRSAIIPKCQEKILTCLLAPSR